jgi:Outer membrane cobalamin receptor protein
MPAVPITTDQIVITASRAPQSETQTPASVTIIDQQRIERLDEPLVSALLRLTPSAAVATSGPAGSLTEVASAVPRPTIPCCSSTASKSTTRLPATHPATKFLNADLASRIEVVRGPQPALWGSEAIGGVIAVNGLDDAPGYAASAEAGSFGFFRTSGSGSLVTDRANLSGAVGFQRATGINSVAGPGDRDGYRNLSGRLRATWHPRGDVQLGASALALSGRSEFDGFDPFTGAHAARPTAAAIT